LNPGLAGTFPWLSNIANNFEQYRVNRMKFCYLTRTGTNVPGSVLMAPDYDAADAAPVTEQAMSNYAEVVEDAPWKDICCVLRPSGMHALGPKKFVRSGTVPSTDIKTYDVGTFILATTDGTGVNWGKVWVEYDIEFFEPQLSNINGSSSTVQGTTGTAASFVSSANPAIAGPLISGIAGNVVSFQNMIVGAEYYVSAGNTAGAGATIAWSALTNLALKNLLDINAGTTSFTAIATATTGSVTATWGANATNPILVATQIPTGTL